MKITILAIGKKHDPKLAGAINDYSDRLQHYTKLDWKLVEAKITPSMGEQQIRELESNLLRQSISPEDTVVLLDEHGTELDSPGLASSLQQYMNKGTKQLVIIIGGAYGVDQELIARSDFIWGLGKLVFPHQLVRLVLSEQLYRAHTIIAGEKYHHA